MKNQSELLYQFLKETFPNGYKLQSSAYPLYIWLSEITSNFMSANLTSGAQNLIEQMHCFKSSEYLSFDEMFNEAKLSFK